MGRVWPPGRLGVKPRSLWPGLAELQPPHFVDETRGSVYTPPVIPAILLGGCLLGLSIVLLLRGMSPRSAEPQTVPPDRKTRKEPAPGPRPGRCPLCGSLLSPGLRVKSDISPGEGDRLMRIFGCPRCWPVLPESLPRSCPVCQREIAADGHAIARYFERPGRKHVHVLGCTGCRSARGGIR